ncbi:unnamed protein product [Blepharisma stoltei]|uniref:RAVE complex protein Rav1 C-terminal domain-containing protein n=1 Tax=Blepharisma stoltei TaxID=1481888 RepID=A0AAU9JPN9_9CILI|nr:unnamed protein product [Blepharisma stoltei]
MKTVQIIPSAPNHNLCISLGCYDEVFLLAFGSGKNIVIVKANTFTTHQVLSGFHQFDVSSVGWARTGGKLATGSHNLIVIFFPKLRSISDWEPKIHLKPEHSPTSLSWSFFGDILLSVSKKVCVWTFDSKISEGIETIDQPFWSAKVTYDKGVISPDGRLIAVSKNDSKVMVYYKEGDYTEESKLQTDALKLLRLNHSSYVTWLDWKDISVFKLYLNKYNPNSLLTICEDGWIRIWSEYSSPQGIGFNVLFQLKTDNGMANWLRDFRNMENNISLLAQKQDALRQQHGDIEFTMNSRSCLIRSKTSEPDKTLYGAMMREKTPVEWLVVAEKEKVTFFMCEGVGAFPLTAINIKSQFQYEHYFGTEAVRWIPAQLPFFVIREVDEVQIISADITRDLVRWRRMFQAGAKDSLYAVLTGVMGGHFGEIIQIETHKSLPLMCTIDITGAVRIWTTTSGVRNDEKAIDEFRHWGVLEDFDYTYVKWLRKFAMLVCGRRNGYICIYKWFSDTPEQLKLLTMHWQTMHCWIGLNGECEKLKVGDIEVLKHTTFRFLMLAKFKGMGYIIYEVFYDGLFDSKIIYQDDKEFKDSNFHSFVEGSEGNSPGKFVNHFILLNKHKIESFLVKENSLEPLWARNLEDEAHTMKLTRMIAVVSRQSVLFLNFEGDALGKYDAPFTGKIIIDFFNIGLATENVILGLGKKILIISQEFLNNVEESDMPWRLVKEVELENEISCIGITMFQQIVTGNDRNLMIYRNTFLQEKLNVNQEPKPHYHPTILFELMRSNKNELVLMILKKLEMQLDEGNVTHSLKLKSEEFLEAKNSEQKPQEAPKPQDASFDWFFESQVVQAPLAMTKEEEFTEKDAARLKEKLQTLEVELPGISGNIFSLIQLQNAIDCFAFVKNQSRTMDEFLRVFYINCRIFNLNLDQKQRNKTQCLNTMDIAWALHSDQQDTLFQTLFTQELTWPQMRMFGMGIWLKSIWKLKAMVENIAKNEFRANKDPKTVSLWYLILGKKNILLGLYKNDYQNQKIYSFLQNDFSNKEWQIKAQKNAFELRKQRKYEMSAAFFLLGDKLIDAIEVLVQDLGDPQLALVVAKLCEGENGPIQRQIIEKYFIPTALKAKDPWLLSLSYALLNMPAETLDCLSFFKNEQLEDTNIEFWNEKVQPTLSGFHPTMTYYIKLLKSKVQIKRNFEAKGLSLEKFEKIEKDMVSRCAENFINAGLSIIALKSIKDEPINLELVDEILKTHLLMIIRDTANKEWKEKFPTLVSEIRYLTKAFNFSEKRLIDFFSNLFYKRDLRNYQCSLLAGMNLMESAAESVLHIAALVHIILSRYSRDPFFEIKTKTLTNVTHDVLNCIELLKVPGTDLYQLHISQKTHLFHMAFSLYLGYFVQAYLGGLWNQAILILQKLQDFLHNINSENYIDIKLDESRAVVENNIITTWLRFLIMNRLKEIISEFDYKEMDAWIDESLYNYNLLLRPGQRYPLNKDMTPMLSIEMSLGPGRGTKRRPLMAVSRLLERVSSWRRRLLLRAQKAISNETMQEAQKYINSLITTANDLPDMLKPHFADASAYHIFNSYAHGMTQIHLLMQSSAQGLSTFIYENKGKVSNMLEKEGFIYEENMKENANIFRNGIEIYRSKDPVLGFAVNHCNNKNMAIAHGGKKERIREINIEHSLKYKKRNEDLEIDTEYPDTWQECMHYLDNKAGAGESIYNPAINSAIYTLYAPRTQVFLEEMELPPPVWNRTPFDDLLMPLASTKNRLDKVDHICGHPLLPLYVTGNENGQMTLWQYERPNSLQDFTPNMASSQINFLSFNSYGDKLGVCDDNGNFFLYKFDLLPSSFSPQLTMMGSISSKSSAFCFLNLGSVVAVIGSKPRGFVSIYDTLVPLSQSLIHTDAVGGTTLNYISRYQQLIIGEKSGKMTRYDLRMQKVIDKIDSGHDSIKDIVCDPTEITFATGGKEGLVKIWDSRSFTLRETIEVSKKSRSNKAITKLQFVETSLLASVEDGSVKLLRITTH